MLRCWLLLLLAGLPIFASATQPGFDAPLSVQREASKLIGTEYPMGSESIKMGSTCVERNESELFDVTGSEIKGWKTSAADCKGFLVILLKKEVDVTDRGGVTYRVTDAVATPAISNNDSHMRKKHLVHLVTSEDSSCDFDGHAPSFSFAALLVWDRNFSASGKKGQIKRAYRFDLQSKRIVPFDVKQLDCEKPSE